MSVLLLGLLIFYAYSLECSSLPTQNITLEFTSDLDDWVVGNLYPDGAFAVAAENNYTRREAPYGLKIWESAFPYDLKQNISCYFGKSFNIPGSPISGILSVKADDYCTVQLNNQNTSCKTNWYNELKNCDLTQFLRNGINTLNISVTNIGGIASLNYYFKITTSVKAIDIV